MTTATKSKTTRIHALTAGTHHGLSGPVTITDTDLLQVASKYNPAVHEAPVVLGHPETNGPAFGWIDSADVQPDGLWLEANLAPEMKELVDLGHYKKVSVSLFTPNCPTNPHPGCYSLRHLGFLGATPPAVKALKSIVLQESGDHLTIETNKKEMPMDPKLNTPKDPALALAEKQTEVLLAEQKNKEREQVLLLAELDIAKREKALSQQGHKSIVQGHIQAGRILPKDEATVIAFMEAMNGKTVDLAEGQKPLLDQFTAFLSGLPKQVELSEVTPADPTTKAQPASFAAPQGFSVDPVRLAELNKANAWLRENPGKTMTDAVRALGL